MSRVINSTSDRITIIKNGKQVYNRDPSTDAELNAAAKIAVLYVLSQTTEGSGGWSDGFFSRLGYIFGDQKYPIDEFIITSMSRTGENSPHGKDLAVDFIVKPLYLNVAIFNDLAKIGTGSATFISCPLWTDAQRKQKNTSVTLHVHYDTARTKGSKNLKSVEYEQTQIDGSCATITPSIAETIMSAYAVPSGLRDEYKNALIDSTSGRGVTIPDTAPDSWVPQNIDPEKILKMILGYAAAGLLLYGGFKLVQAGALDRLLNSGNKKKAKAEKG
jgi:hypothetical protein